MMNKKNIPYQKKINFTTWTKFLPKYFAFFISGTLITFSPVKASWEWQGDMSSLIIEVIDGANSIIDEFEIMGEIVDAPKVDLRWCENGTFYNSEEKYICFQPKLMNQLAKIGDAAIAFVAAHEYAHHIIYSNLEFQKLDGTNVLREELQADCFAGYILAKLPNMKFDENDIVEMLGTANLSGDKDYDDNLNHHGSGENRTLALRSGLTYGSIEKKDLYFNMFCIQE